MFFVNQTYLLFKSCTSALIVPHVPLLSFNGIYNTNKYT